MHLLNKLVVKTIPVIPRQIVRKFARRYIAGDRLEDAVNTTKRLNGQDIMTTIDFLGEDVFSKDDALNAKKECIKILDAIDNHNLNANQSLKLTSLGLKIDYDFCLKNMEDIVSHADRLQKIFIRIDMEDSSCTDDTIKIYRDLRRKFQNVGIVIQSYLKRSEKDVLDLSKEGTNFRLCKGIYVEPEEIAYKDRQMIRDNFLKLLRIIFQNNCYVGIATHDEYLIDGAYSLISEFRKDRGNYEFQMLLGVRENLRDKILKDGHRVRVYVPYGTHWYEYSVRRFQENPQIAGYVMKSILGINS
ncbi:MAG: proline dehydrogenase family protein [Ignavibacteria bacterium]|nr:proline dehydrogenase family protein [Ignavibacteria bacterium]